MFFLTMLMTCWRSPGRLLCSITCWTTSPAARRPGCNASCNKPRPNNWGLGTGPLLPKHHPRVREVSRKKQTPSPP